MKAISLHQPWASLIALGIKNTETRHWSTRYRGEIAIHAAKAWDGKKKLAADQIRKKLKKRLKVLDDPPRGAIVAVADLFEVVEFGLAIPSWASLHDVLCGNFAQGRFGWRLRHIRALSEPVPVKGFQNMWTLSPQEATEVAKRVA